MSIAVKNHSPFIFIHLPRTAGRSITQALESSVNEKHILKFIQPHPINIRYKNDDGSYEYEKKTIRQLGLDPPPCKPNYLSEKDGPYAYLHASLEDFATALNSALEEYYKFSVIRNPWDMVLSYYFYTNHIHKINDIFDKEYFINTLIPFVASYNQIEMLSLDGEIKLNKYLKFENLEKDFSEVLEELNLPKTTLPHVKESENKVKNYRDFYDKESKEKVEELFKEYIEVFNYKF